MKEAMKIVEIAIEDIIVWLISLFFCIDPRSLNN
jgi:hypothetical protein